MRRVIGFWLAAGALMSGAAAKADSPRLEDLATAEVNDLQARVQVVLAEQSELEKISRDFGMMYRLRDLNMRYKDPDKLRMEGRVGTMIVNGCTRYFHVPQLRLKKKDELTEEASRRYSLFELGILSRHVLSAVQSRFLREERLDGVPHYLFEIVYRGDVADRFRVWIDPKARVVRKREWYDSSGKLRATFLYQEIREASPGLWIPSRLEIRNQEGAVAGITTYSELKVNQGLDDTPFLIP